MALAQIPGSSLLSNLDRQGYPLSFTTNGNALVAMDFSSFSVGINEANPGAFGQSLVVNGNALIEAGHILSTGNLIYSIGNVTNQWNTVYANSISGTLLTASQPNITSIGTLGNLTVTGSITSSTINANITGNLNASNNRIINVGAPVTSTDAATKAYVDTAIASESSGNLIPLGTPTVNSGNLQANAAYLGFTTGTLITDAIDILNSVTENLFTNTFVRSVSFSANTTAGGAGQDVLLTMVPQGNVNQYVINWGDGTANTTTSSTTATHQYATNAGTPFTVTVVASNTNGAGPSNTATATIPGYIQIYGPNPVMSFNLYRTNTGGTVLSGNNLYVIQGNTVYLQNTTTNTATSTVTWSVLWGDGTTSNIASNSNSGGVLGANLSYTYNSNSGTSTDTVTLNLLTDNLANPAIIPMSTTQALKVYANVPPTPYGTSTRSLGFGTSTGTSPYLAYGYTDNTGGTTLTAGSSVNRATYNQATILINTGTITNTYTYTANAGILTALINNVGSGNVNLALPQTTGIYGNLGLSALSDYNLVSQSGAATTFASSIYYPGWGYGFQANVYTSGSKLPVGVNRAQIVHSITGSTPNVDFVVDNVTSTPTLSVGNIAIQTAGTYRYISGIPYFNSGSPTLWVQNVTIGPNWIGQTYASVANPLQVLTGQYQEGTSSAVVNSTSYSYTQLSNSSATMLNGSTPIANTGNASPYAIANLTLAITSSSIRSIANIGMYVTNVNGTAATQYGTTNVAVHTASQSGISEIAITANASLGDGTYTSSGVRSFYFNAATTNTPSYVNSTNFYTTNIYSEASNPGVAGTKEATIRLGVLAYNVNNYSTGYLPAGPNRSGDTGTQYFTFAFQRKVVANFSLNIVAPSGVAGVWIAAPGTTLDSTSTLNGWLDCSTTYAGSGKPGANTGAGGNGSNGCAFTSGDRIQANVALNGTFKQTLGTENLTNATNNVALVRIALVSGQSVTTLGVV